MSIQPLLRFQDYQFQVTSANGPWRWTTRIDVSHSVAVTQIRDIITPYGLLRDSVPLPGEVVEAMADSIVQVQLAYPPSILLNPVSLNFVVDEGRGVSDAKSVSVTNTGILGSLLSTTVTSSAAYVIPTPANVEGLAANESGGFRVAVDSTNLLAANSPLTAQLVVQSCNATNSPKVVAVGIVIRPKAIITPTPLSLVFNVVKPVTGDFPPIPSQQITLANTGPGTSVLDYQIRKLIGAQWLTSFSPVYGSVNGGSIQPIAVVVAPPSSTCTGTYIETLRFTGYSTNMSVDVTVTLNIT